MTTETKPKRPRRKAEYVLLQVHSEGADLYKVALSGGTSKADILAKAVCWGPNG